jgi:hypothetical protein
MLLITQEEVKPIKDTILEALSKEFAKQGFPQPDLTGIEDAANLVPQEDADNGHTDDE